MDIVGMETGGTEDLDPSLMKNLKQFFGLIPFNKQLGLEIVYVGQDRVDIRLPMKPDLIGNFMHNNLHGGVISSALDVAGGLMAVIGAFRRTKEMPMEERAAILSKIGTIDLRIDYLRPGRGEWFLASGRLLRTGNKVAVTRMSFHNDQEELQAVGTGTYLCG